MDDDNRGLHSISEMDANWDKGGGLYVGNVRGERANIMKDCWTAPGFSTDHLRVHNACWSMAEYIGYLRAELAHRDHLQGKTREFLGIDRAEVLA